MTSFNQGETPAESTKGSGIFDVLVAALSSIDMRGEIKATPYRRFKRDPYYLLKYYLINLALLITATTLIQLFSNRFDDFNVSPLWLVGLVLFVLPNFALIFLSGLYYLVLIALVQPHSLSFLSLALIPAGLLAGTISAALMHNASHDNFKPKWSNRVWGEICGLFQLHGYCGWCISHTIHHAAPDDPEMDPHPPGMMTFSAYANAMGIQMKNNITEKYFETFGRNKHSETTWKTVGLLLPATRYMRALFILFLLGPTAFVLLYVPYKIANALIYVDFNYRTHRPTEDGAFEVLNLNHNLWFKFLNAVSFGSYYHKNHHRKLDVFNPKYAGLENDPPLITYRAD